MYKLELTEQDIKTIDFVGHRYNWSTVLCPYELGINDIPEHEMWEIVDAFEEDTEGGHSYFPMLDHGSELCKKLVDLMNSVV